jgi:hypothetical protein
MQAKSVGRAVPSLTEVALEFVEHCLEARYEQPSAFVWLSRAGASAFFVAVQVIQEEPWLIRGTLARDAVTGLVNVGQLTVEPLGHGSEVTGTVLRKVKVAKIRDSALRHLRFIGFDPVVHFSADSRPLRVYPDVDKPRYAALIAEPSRKRRGRPGLPESRYREVALAYLELYNSGLRRGIHGELMRRYSAPYQTVRDWVARARKLGYLTPGQPGRAGAEPGPRLSDLPD